MLSEDASAVLAIVIQGRKAPGNEAFVDWFFDGLGTILIGLILGGAAGSTVTWRIMSKRATVKQRQRAGNNATQVQVGRDARVNKR